jgi:hypothetical protein
MPFVLNKISAILRIIFNLKNDIYHVRTMKLKKTQGLCEFFDEMLIFS